MRPVLAELLFRRRHCQLRFGDHIFEGKAEFLGQFLQGRAGPEGFHGNDALLVVDVARPANLRGLLDGDAGRAIGRQDAVAIRFV